MLQTLCPTTNVQAYPALIPSAGTGVIAWNSQPSNDGLNIAWSTRPASITPYAAPSSRIVGQPRPVLRVTSRISSAPHPYSNVSRRRPPAWKENSGKGTGADARGVADVRGTGDSSSTEFLYVTVWNDVESIRAFAGERWQKAVITPDEEHLLKDTWIEHYETIETG
jgi:hypothetical protein